MKRTYIGPQTVCNLSNTQELVVHSLHYLPADSGPSRNSVAFSALGEDHLQRSCGTVGFKIVRHLSRPAAQGDLAEFSFGRRLHEDIWYPCSESCQHLAEFTQSSSQPQFEAQRFSHRVISHNDQRPIFEVLKRGTLSISFHASPAHHLVRLFFRFSRRHVHSSAARRTAGALRLLDCFVGAYCDRRFADGVVRLAGAAANSNHPCLHCLRYLILSVLP